MLSNINLKKVILCTIITFFLTACSPGADFYFINGQPGRLTDYHGRWLLINYWAEWCKPCIAEVPELNKFYLQHTNEYSIISVSYDIVSNEELLKQASRFGILYPMVASIPKPDLGIELPIMLPSNYLISPTGRTYGPLIGPQSVESILAAFQKAKELESVQELNQ